MDGNLALAIVHEYMEEYPLREDSGESIQAISGGSINIHRKEGVIRLHDTRLE